MGVLEAITSVANVGSAALKEAQQHEGLKNSPAMIQAHVLDAQQAEIDRQRKLIANEDLEAYRLAVAATPRQ
jgi:hypothetical protein